MEKEQLVLDLGSNTIHKGERPGIRIQPLQAKLLAILARNHPLPVGYSFLGEQLWSVDRTPADVGKTLMVHIHRLRDILSSLGIGIDTKAKGYAIRDKVKVIERSKGIVAVRMELMHRALAILEKHDHKLAEIIALEIGQ